MSNGPCVIAAVGEFTVCSCHNHYIYLQGNWDTSGSELSEGELEKQRRTLLEQLDEDQ